MCYIAVTLLSIRVFMVVQYKVKFIVLCAAYRKENDITMRLWVRARVTYMYIFEVFVYIHRLALNYICHIDFICCV